MENDDSWPGASKFLGNLAHSELLAESRANLRLGFEDVATDTSPGEDSLARRMFNNISICSHLWPIAHKGMPWNQSIRQRYANLSVQLARANSLSVSTFDRWADYHPLHVAQDAWTKQVLHELDLAVLGDRPYMLNGEEARAPYLDKPLSDYGRHLPPAMKINVDPDSNSICDKYALRKAAHPFITPEVSARAKKVSDALRTQLERLILTVYKQGLYWSDPV